MTNHSLRVECDDRFAQGSCLRNLACDIASLEWIEAKQHGLVNASPAPYNLLANGETGSGWICPTDILPTDLIAWKNAANGFVGSTHRGLSLLFDPFVDACLLIEAKKANEAFQRTKVLVLTDYYPILQIGIKAGQDWGAEETENFFMALGLGLSGNNIFKALAEEGSIESVRNTSEDEIRGLFSEKHLLIWNYFPFFRGGNNCQGTKGLPSPIGDCRWIHYCEGLLKRFLDCVNASHVIFAMNQAVRSARLKCVSSIPSAELNHPGSCRSIQKLEAWGSQLREVLEYNLCQE